MVGRKKKLPPRDLKKRTWVEYSDEEELAVANKYLNQDKTENELGADNSPWPPPPCSVSHSVAQTSTVPVPSYPPLTLITPIDSRILQPVTGDSSVTNESTSAVGISVLPEEEIPNDNDEDEDEGGAISDLPDLDEGGGGAIFVLPEDQVDGDDLSDVPDLHADDGDAFSDTPDAPDDEEVLEDEDEHSETLPEEMEDMEYFAFLQSISRKWMDVELEHDVSKTASNAFWKIGMQFFHVLHERKKTAKSY